MTAVARRRTDSETGGEPVDTLHLPIRQLDVAQQTARIDRARRFRIDREQQLNTSAAVSLDRAIPFLARRGIKIHHWIVAC